MHMLRELCILTASTSKRKMTCGAARIALHCIRVGTLQNHVIVFCAAKALAAQSVASAPFPPAMRNIGT